MPSAEMPLEVLVGPLPVPEDASRRSAAASGRYWYEPFDMLLLWRSQGRVLALERSLRDMAAFANDLRGLAPPGDGHAALRWEQLAFERGEDSLGLLETPRARRQRLRYALEAFVSEQLARSPLPLVVQRFVAPSVFTLPCSDSTWVLRRQEYQRAVEEVLEVAATAADLPLPPLGTAAASAASDAWTPPQTERAPLPLLLRDEWISAGCSLEHELVVRAGDDDASGKPALVAWRFVSQREQLKFAVHFSPVDAVSTSTDRDQDADRDLYSAAGFHAAYEMEPEDASASEFEGKWQVVRYQSAIDFLEDLTDDSRAFACGHWLASRPGTLRFAWENADMNCVLSKQLQFQVAVVPYASLDPDTAGSIGLAERLDVIESLCTPGADTQPLMVTLPVLLESAAKSVDDVIPGWCGADEDESIGGYRDRDSLAALASDDAFNSTNLIQSERAELVGDVVQAHQINQLEAKVAELEQSLKSAKQELREAHNRTEVANEIYKASLETITRLEHEAAVTKRTRLQPDISAQPTSAVPSEVANRVNTHGIDAGEHERVKSLCASFQEQCLWRSIETAESEKRNLQLEAQLNAALSEKQTVSDELEATKRELVVMEQQVRKLKAHRTVLAQEVKRLQPYSQANLAALVQEAQEARMMQRSLQTQLDCLRGHESGAAQAVETIGDEENPNDDEPDAAAGGFVAVPCSRHEE